MGSFALYILTALALVLVIEGLIYALFPTAVRSMMAMALAMDEKNMRIIGIILALSGFFVAWFLQSFAGS